MRRSVGIVALAFLAIACRKKVDEAPRSVDGILHDIYRDYDDPALRATDLTDLQDWLLNTAPSLEDGVVLSDLTEADTAAVDHPDVPLEGLLGAAVAGVSPFSVYEHAATMTLPDQVWNEPGSLVSYTREVEGDAAAFEKGKADIFTTNDIVKEGAFSVQIPYVLFKDYRWNDLEDGSRVVVTRSWTSDVSCGEDGKNCVVQSFSIEIFVGEPGTADGDVAGETTRLIASWSELDTVVDGIISDDFLISELVKGIHDIYDATDAFLAGTQTTN